MDAQNVLTGRVALVTGGSRGIGRATAEALAAAGAAVAVNYRSRKDEAEAGVAEIERAGGRGMVGGAGVWIAAEVDAMVEEVRARFGEIDILVNNAGRGVFRTV